MKKMVPFLTVLCLWTGCVDSSNQEDANRVIIEQEKRRILEKENLDNEIRVAHESATVSVLSGIIASSQDSFLKIQESYGGEDNLLRYGFIDEMTGNKATSFYAKGECVLLPDQYFEKGEFASLVNGYFFKIYIPNGELAAFSNSDIIDITGMSKRGIAMMASHYVVYAWPKDEKSGSLMFAMAEDGQVYTLDGTYDFRYGRTNMPPWDLMWGDNKPWSTDKKWHLYKKP